MRINGTIRAMTSAGAALSEWGEPAAQEQTWSDPVPCHIKTDTEDRTWTYSDGTQRRASFTVLTEGPQAMSLAGRVKLERLGEELGEFEIVSIVPVASMNRVKITV